ncbi:MAG: GGDEF domain-containing protein, partial [Bdellovibrionales bacterium]|nr:GGDEF domain-containing protein [Bdellovibrionales bacterium]
MSLTSKSPKTWIIIAGVFIFLLGYYASSREVSPSQSIQLELTDWYFCEGLLDQLDDQICEYTKTPKKITPRNVGEPGTYFTYFATYHVDRSLTVDRYALNLGAVGDEDTVYIDNQYVGSTKYTHTSAVAFQDWKYHPIDSNHVLEGNHNVRINVLYYGPMFGGVLAVPAVTTLTYAQIKKTRYNFYRSYLPFACCIALIFLSFYSGLVGIFGKNQSFFIDYMGFGTCFSLYIGSIGFVYTYLGFTWLATMILFSTTIIGSLFFSLRLIAQSSSFSHNQAKYKKYANYFILILSILYTIMFINKNYVPCVLLLQNLLVTLIVLFSFYYFRHGLSLIKKEGLTTFAISAVLVAPLFFTSIAIDFYKQFFDAGSIFVSPYALIAIGFCIMFYLAQDHVKALKDQKMKEELEEKNIKLKYLSEHDPLTALYNRRTFESLVEYNINSANQHKGYALLILDIDHFKSYNDSYGHPAGDRLLIQFAKVLNETVRLSDPIGRLGGEEFGIFIHNVTFDQAKQICENIRSSIESTSFEHKQKNGNPITASIGAVYFSPEIEAIQYTNAYKLSDECL